MDYSIKGIGETGKTSGKKIKLDHYYLTLYSKRNSRGRKGWNVRSERTKLLEENTGEFLYFAGDKPSSV